MDERAFYKESQTTKPITLNCPLCRSVESYDLKWLLRTKVDRLPGNADERPSTWMIGTCRSPASG